MVLYFLLVILSTFQLCMPNGEIVSYILPENCSEREYYVPGVMSCTLCDDNQKSSIDRKYLFLKTVIVHCSSLMTVCFWLYKDCIVFVKKTVEL